MIARFLEQAGRVDLGLIFLQRFDPHCQCLKLPLTVRLFVSGLTAKEVQ